MYVSVSDNETTSNETSSKPNIGRVDITGLALMEEAVSNSP